MSWLLMSARLFWEEVTDFSKQTSFSQKTLNIFLVIGFNFFWVTLVILFFTEILGLFLSQVIGFVQVTVTDQLVSQIAPFREGFSLFFLVCVLVPLWEEVIFRYLPISFAQLLDEWAQKQRMLLPIVLSSSIIFGILHGSILNIPIQGMIGLSFCWLYLRNNNSYWSVVVAHAMWNFIVIFGLEYIAG